MITLDMSRLQTWLYEGGFTYLYWHAPLLDVLINVDNGTHRSSLKHIVIIFHMIILGA